MQVSADTNLCLPLLLPPWLPGSFYLPFLYWFDKSLPPGTLDSADSYSCSLFRKLISMKTVCLILSWTSAKYTSSTSRKKGIFCFCLLPFSLSFITRFGNNFLLLSYWLISFLLQQSQQYIFTQHANIPQHLSLFEAMPSGHFILAFFVLLSVMNLWSFQ